jgi:hypothetical protein
MAASSSWQNLSGEISAGKAAFFPWMLHFLVDTYCDVGLQRDWVSGNAALYAFMRENNDKPPSWETDVTESLDMIR